MCLMCGYWICILVRENTYFFEPLFLIDIVPYVASWSILLKILDFWGGMWEMWIFIDYNGLDYKLHYCNKSCDIFMIVGFHLLCFPPGLFLAGNAKFKSVFFPLEYRFLFETAGACISPLLYFFSALCKAFWEKYFLFCFFFNRDLV